jgi:uncharacterized protein
MTASAQDIIDRLELAPHPEGGWYRQVWRDTSEPRGAGSSIHFLLGPGEKSHWHRIDAAELWMFQAGSALQLQVHDGEQTASYRLGPDVLGGDSLQVLVLPGQWQAAQAIDGWGLVACVVVPAFEFAGFELAPPGWEPATRPDASGP